MIYRQIILLLLISLFTLPVSAEQLRKLEVEVSFTPPTDASLVHTGYRLYKNSVKWCDATDTITSGPVIFECTTEDGTFDFTLTALYNGGSDNGGSESSPSPAFSFTIGETPVTTEPPVTSPPDTPTGSKKITYSWDTPTDTTNITGYGMYMNNTLLCETADTTATSLSCFADLLNTVMTFSITSYDTSGLASSPSNFLTLDPDDFPELFQKKSITLNWEYSDNNTNAGGFQVFFNSNLLCATTDYTARTITCEVDNLALENEFKIAAVDAYGTATFFSNVIVYSATAPSTTDPPITDILAATITATPTNGVAPLSVAFDGTGSTGDINSFSWEFGDGSSATGSTANHSYTIAGTYTTTLTLIDTNSDIAVKTIDISVQEPAPVTPVAPTAVIASSVSLGEAPLDVNFDGTGSTDGSAPIVDYTWDYGDGATGIGNITDHTFSTSGSYTTMLEITDSGGLTDTATTPVVVSEPATPNQQPVASFIATPTQGTTPFTVTFNGTASTDSDGTVNSYYWNFGDGNTGAGSSTQHTYTTEAIYTATLQVQDDQGLKSDIISQTITATAEEETGLIYELGELALTHEWVQVAFDTPFTNPVIIAGPPTSNDPDPTLVRIRNVTPSGFEIRLQEWDYQDKSHSQEYVSYLALEQGLTTLEDGTLVEAGTFTGTMKSQTLSLQQTFITTPVIITTIQTENDTNAITGRVSATGPTGFSHLMQEEEGADKKHSDETIGYLAWEPGTGTITSALEYEATTLNNTTDSWNTATFTSQFQSLPYVFADMQTINGRDPASVRMNNLTQTSVDLKIAEEQAKNTETDHVSESVGYLSLGAISSTGFTNTRKLTFSWNYTGDIQNIRGFRIYLNSTAICETSDVSATQLECSTNLISGSNGFTIKAIQSTGEETNVSNTITYEY